ncbi:beta-ketoacyl synthase N-terminal-like domain-containing protein, partial [Streptomyces sp. NRRL F-5123]|uniref:beta-ketoacyl synthase N-terminal-like domain-containing protein n=1 Tax=Streptomyces sp. NRRL F-5123 TaxID=1463856 RepID=UPI0005BE7550
VFDYPTLHALAGYLDEQIGGTTAVPAAAAPSPTSVGTGDDPIVIVGMACRLPGGIESPDGLWRAVSEGVDAVSEF